MDVVVVHADTYVGHAIARALVRKSVAQPTISVRIVVRRKESVEDLIRTPGRESGAHLELIDGVPPSRAAVDRACSNARILILTLVPTPRMREDAIAYLEAAERTHQIRGVILVVPAHTTRPYPAADVWTEIAAIEQALRDRSTKYPGLVIRVSLIQQSFGHLAEIVRGKAVFPLSLGPSGSLAPVHLGDVADGIHLLVQKWLRTPIAQPLPHAFGLLLFTGSQAMTGSDMARAASRALKFEIVYADIKTSTMRQILTTVAGMTLTEVEVLMAMLDDARTGPEAETSRDLQDLLGTPTLTVQHYFEQVGWNSIPFLADTCHYECKD
jgi:nucleoside-diphosphate-sugar epimerase